MSVMATLCIDDVIAKLKLTSEFGAGGLEKIFTVYSEGDLLDKTKLVKYPAIGVMYEGIRANGLDPSRQGLAGDLTIAIVLLIDGKSVGNLDQKNEASRILDVVRTEFNTKCRKSPTGHAWKFISEIPVGDIGNVLAYTQRWSTAIMLT